MRPSRRWTDEEGTASLEFITAGLVLLVPLVYLVLAVSAIQGGALAVEGAARQAARVFVQADTAEEATARAERAVRFALADYGIDDSTASVSILCRPDPDACHTRRGFVTVEVATRVPLPFAPPVLDVDAALSVPLGSSATQQVSRLWGAGQ
jgi:Flp pilus assembly protein TadG